MPVSQLSSVRRGPPSSCHTGDAGIPAAPCRGRVMGRLGLVFFSLYALLTNLLHGFQRLAHQRVDAQVAAPFLRRSRAALARRRSSRLMPSRATSPSPSWPAARARPQPVDWRLASLRPSWPWTARRRSHSRKGWWIDGAIRRGSWRFPIGTRPNFRMATDPAGS